MDNKTPQHIIDKIAERHKQDNSQRQIQRRLLDELDFEIGKTTIQRRIKKLEQQQEVISELNKVVGKEEPYTFDDVSKEYAFITKDTRWQRIEIKMPLSLVDDIFACFSQYGKNRTQQQCIDHFELTPQAWNLVKGRLRLTKFSPIVSPITAESMGDGELDEHIKQAIGANIHDKFKNKFKKHYPEELKKEAKKAFKVLANVESYAEYLKEFLVAYKPKDFGKLVIPPKANNETATYVFSDIHVGSKGTDAIKERIQKMTIDMIQDEASNINIINLWDLAETFIEWGMHPWQVEDMDGVYWFDLMMQVVEMMENMIVQLFQNWKSVHSVGIGWNHDRSLQNHNQDMRRTGALVVYELVKRWLQKIDAHIEYFTDKINSFDIDDVHYVIHHGDEWFDKRKVEDILWKWGKQWVSNIVLHWDKHHISMNETKDGIMIGTPALANRWEYAKRIDARSQPWYIKITKNNMWDLDVLLRRMA